MSLGACFEAIWSRKGQASEAERWERRIFFIFSAMCWFFALIAVLFVDMRTRPALFIGACSIFPLVSGVLLRIACGYRLTHTVMVSFLWVAAGIILIADTAARLRMRTLWPILVLVVDFLLVLQVDEKHTARFVAMAVFFLSLLSAETVFRFGVFDLPFMTSQDTRREYAIEQISCEKLPCPAPLQEELVFCMGSLFIFVVDFVATRGFARRVLAEQAVMQRTIATVQEITRLLAQYDVEGVATMLSEESNLPPLMHETLKEMEENLRNYRPYLPAALFEKDTTEKDGTHIYSKPPGLQSGVATIVFTDIRSSTAIWECAPEGMRVALQIHNTIMREVMQRYNGYEVKTIGDSFMLAFETTKEGMDFALSVHEELRNASWPASLQSDAPICATQGSLWGGLTVRIGINTGPITVEQNTLTGRTDYFGHTVNIASRLENICSPGAVAVLSELWDGECCGCDAVSGAAQSIDLKGVSANTCVRCVWPLSLAGRERSPLNERTAQSQSPLDTTLQVASSHSGSSASVSAYRSSHGVEVSATVGIVEIAVNNECPSIALRSMSSGLGPLSGLLDQSGGVLVTLLGNCVCVGWNLGRSTPSHMENAIRFAQRLQKTALFTGAGFVSGQVFQGDVGTNTQRFVTVIGRSVRRSWALCESAVEGGVGGGVGALSAGPVRGCCLYETPEGALLPPTLEGVLIPTQVEGVYTVVNKQRPRSVQSL